MALDLDCFYAQVVMVARPSLREQPLGITQKYLVVTCNYPARRAGVGKLMGITEAKKLCPSLVLIPGERLDPFRAASKAIADFIQAELERECMLVSDGIASKAQDLHVEQERCGMDELFLDATALCTRLAARRDSRDIHTATTWHGHVVGEPAQETNAVLFSHGAELGARL